MSTFLIHCVRWYGWLDAILSSVRHRVQDTIRRILHPDDYDDLWHLSSEYALSDAYYRRHRGTGEKTLRWTYHRPSNTLMESPLTEKKDHDRPSYPVGWLSAEIELEMSDGTLATHSMDTFLESFSVSSAQSFPTLSHVFLAWCAHRGTWYPGATTYRIRIIDCEANEHTVDASDTSFQPANSARRLVLSAKMDGVSSTPFKDCKPEP